MKLTPRLEKIASMVPECTCIGDVGTDHAYIPAALIERGIVTKAIASDVVDGPVLNAQNTIARYGFANHVEVRKGSGLAPYAMGEIEGVIIAGMGGPLIAEIIEADYALAQSLNFLILQPMIGQEVLRAYLESHHFKIVEEHIEVEGEKFYEVMKVTAGEMMIDEPFYYEIGPLLVHQTDEKTKGFMGHKLKKYEKIYRSVKENASQDQGDYLLEIERKISLLKELI
ncbi:MAG: SAM-dependent methyltransferase [Clostridia bacterium]|nr:SAM-dependent methyltransferase [Clostridia bacterium]